MKKKKKIRITSALGVSFNNPSWGVQPGQRSDRGLIMYLSIPISSSANAPDRNTGPILSTDTRYVSLMSKSSRPANMYKALNYAPDPVYFPTTLQTRHCNHSRVQMKRLGHREVICHGVFVQTGTLLHWDDQAQPWRKKAA